MGSDDDSRTSNFTSVSQRVKRLYPGNFLSPLKNLPEESWFARCANYLDDTEVSRMELNCKQMDLNNASTLNLEDKATQTFDSISTEDYNFDEESLSEFSFTESYFNQVHLRSVIKPPKSVKQNKTEIVVAYNATNKSINLQTVCDRVKGTDEGFRSENESRQVNKKKNSAKLDNIPVKPSKTVKQNNQKILLARHNAGNITNLQNVGVPEISKDTDEGFRSENESLEVEKENIFAKSDISIKSSRALKQNKQKIVLVKHEPRKKSTNLQNVRDPEKSKDTDGSFRSGCESLEVKKEKIFAKLCNISPNNQTDAEKSVLLDKVLDILEAIENPPQNMQSTDSKRTMITPNCTREKRQARNIPYKNNQSEEKNMDIAVPKVDQNAKTDQEVIDKTTDTKLTEKNEVYKHKKRKVQNVKRTQKENKTHNQSASYSEANICSPNKEIIGNRRQSLRLKTQVKKPRVTLYSSYITAFYKDTAKNRKLYESPKSPPRRRSANICSPNKEIIGNRRQSLRLKTQVPKPRATLYSSYITAFYKDTTKNRKLYESSKSPPRRSSVLVKLLNKKYKRRSLFSHEEWLSELQSAKENF